MKEDKNQSNDQDTDQIIDYSNGDTASDKTQQTQEAEAHTSDEKINELTNEIGSLKNQLLRRAAEFENYKRRSENETIAIIRMANEGLIVELLSVIDDFERSLKAGKDHPDFDAFYKGIELVRGKLMKILESRGLKRFASIGEQFDVEYHDALLLMPKEGVEPHTIIDEIESGYTLQDKVIRHAKVIVASEPAEEADTTDAASTQQESLSESDKSVGDKEA